MRKRFVALCVSACMFTTLFGGTMVHAADANQVTTPTQQEENGDENEKEDIPDMQEPFDPDKVETPDVIPDENDPDKGEGSEIKPEEPEAKPEESDKKEESNKDEEVDPSLPDTESTETNLDDKDACVGIDGEPEPYEVNPYLREATIAGQWIQAADGRWWYRHNNGTYTKNGWEYINGNWFYFDAAGWMVTGWLQSNGNWFYLNSLGHMLIDWQKIDGTWYYFNSLGHMLTGWQQIGGKWYFFNGSGAMLTGWQQIGGKWYYMNSSGAMQTGWLTLGVKKYYLNSSGAMVTGSQTIGGSKYYFVESGELGQHRTKKHEKGYYMTDFNGSRVGVRVYAEITEDIRPETSTTIALVKRTGLLYYRAGGTAGFNFTGGRPRHFNSSKKAIKSFSWQTQSSILPGDAVISMSIVNRTKVVYSNTNTNYSQLSYLISGQPGIESGGGVRSGDAKMLLNK